VVSSCAPRPAPVRRLTAGARVLELGPRPWLMGIVKASPDPFSDGARQPTLRSQAQLAEELLAAGADIIDVGGECAITGRRPVSVEEELDRVVPLVERIAGGLGAIVSVKTCKPRVARGAIAAGASVVNDVSGLRDRQLAEVCAHTGAALVVMHTRAARGERLQGPQPYTAAAEMPDFLRERIAVALGAGMTAEQLIVDPGPDFANAPAQTIGPSSQLVDLHELGRPLLVAISRKDPVGALTDHAPRERLAGTLAVLAHGVDAGAHVFRVHDVAAAADFLAVRAALSGAREPSRDLALAEELRHDRLTG
jgi:dihydropteroate synthase